MNKSLMFNMLLSQYNYDFNSEYNNLREEEKIV